MRVAGPRAPCMSRRCAFYCLQHWVKEKSNWITFCSSITSLRVHSSAKFSPPLQCLISFHLHHHHACNSAVVRCVFEFGGHTSAADDRDSTTARPRCKRTIANCRSSVPPENPVPLDGNTWPDRPMYQVETVHVRQRRRITLVPKTWPKTFAVHSPLDPVSRCADV